MSASGAKSGATGHHEVTKGTKNTKSFQIKDFVIFVGSVSS